MRVDGIDYGAIAAGSATKFLPGRNEFFGQVELNNIVNNIFFHIEKFDNRYPMYNFAVKVVEKCRQTVISDWKETYGDAVLGWESLVELPRTGELYIRDGWEEVGLTKGYTCKRKAGEGTDSWTGKRVWDTQNLRPKRVFVRHL